jgi:hypothetical protein
MMKGLMEKVGRWFRIFLMVVLVGATSAVVVSGLIYIGLQETKIGDLKAANAKLEEGLNTSEWLRGVEKAQNKQEVKLLRRKLHDRFIERRQMEIALEKSGKKQPIEEMYIAAAIGAINKKK